MDPDNEEVRRELSGMLKAETLKTGADSLRAAAIVVRCEDFCNRFPDETIPERCRGIIKDLFDHPAAPLSRGDGVLWSAAIVYAACRDANLIRPGRGGSPLAEEISSFFGFERSSIRKKATALKGFLPDR